MNRDYTTDEPSRDSLDTAEGPVLVEFGAPWCPWCQAAQPLIAQALAGHDAIPHYKIEDGKGRPLGRTYGVKLWPTLIFLRDGREIARLVRPESSRGIREAVEQIVDQD